MTVLVTGGAGYIGSHTCVELLEAGYKVVVLDNLCNGHRAALARVSEITGKPVELVEADTRDRGAVEDTLGRFGCDAVIHFAGLKAVGDSVADPVGYYDNNFCGSVQLLAAMQAAGVQKIIFSSSATVYGEPQFLPYTEDHPLRPESPYGRSKVMVEDMLRDQFRAAPDWTVGILRYFNPVGAHPSGRIGEDSRDTPNNLMPYIAQVAVGRRERLSVFGDDYDTRDGTGERDYIHVCDLARAHVDALRALDTPQCTEVNIGNGRAYSVLEVVAAFAEASGREIPYRIAPRRPGDIASCYADPSKAASLLGWRPRHELAQMCRDHWRWQRDNPEGFGPGEV